MKKYKRVFVGRGFANKKFDWISLILDVNKIIDMDYVKEKDIDLEKLFTSPYKKYQDTIQLLFTLYKNNNKNKPNVTHNLAISLTEEDNNNTNENEKEIFNKFLKGDNK